ncbi:MAG: glycosyltransferase [Candidatus Bathyarchaeia archaeon]
MGQPLISIVLTTFNSEDTISDVLDAIVKQDMPLSNVELIIVDGGSKDQTLEIVRDFLEKYGSLFNSTKLIVHDRNYGVSKARNDGMKASTGKYILILDHDVVMINRSTLANLLKFLSNSPQNVAAVIPLHLTYHESVLDRWVRLIREDRVTYASAITSCALIKREVIDRIGFYDETLGPPFTIAEDTEYYARVKSRGYEALIIGFEKVLHVTDEKNVERKENVQQFSQHQVRARKRLLDILRKALAAVSSIKSFSYRYAYKKYVASLPLLDKLKWYAYSATLLLMALLITVLSIPSIFSIPHQVIQFIALFSFVACLTLYIDALREYWNPKALHASLAYSAVALAWRMLRSTMFLTPVSVRKPAN